MSDRRRPWRGAGGRVAAAAAGVAALALVAGCGGEPTTGPGGGGGNAGELSLAVGESRTVQGDAQGLSFSLPGPGDSGAEYRLAVQSAAEGSGPTAMRVSVSPESGGSSSVRPSPASRPTGRTLRGGWRASELTPEQLGLIDRTRTQRQAREMLVRRSVRPARDEADGRSASGRLVSGQLMENDTVTLSFPIVEREEGVPEITCDTDTAATVTAEVKAVGQRAAMLEDTATSMLGSSNMDYQALATEFDDLVFGVDVAYFGTPTDIDGNGHVMVLFSPKVNDLSDPASEGIFTGLFNPADLADNGDGDAGGGDNLQTCAAGNEGELLYLVAPDPNGNRDAGAISADQAERIARSTSSHEFQHLLNAANRVIKQSGSFADLEQTWLNEGLSHLAEEIVGFAKSNLQLRSNLSAPDAGAGQGGTEEETFNTFIASNLNNLARYLQNPAVTPALVASSPDSVSQSIRMRGFAWVFLRWLADQEFADVQGQVPGTGDPEEQFFRDLAKAGGQNLQSGVANIEGVTGRQWPDILGDFSPMPAVDDDVQSLAGEHRLLTWDMRQIYQSFPLSARSAGFGSNTFDFTVEGGTAKYIFLSSSGSASGVTIELTDQTGQPLTAGSPQITVVRTR